MYAMATARNIAIQARLPGCCRSLSLGSSFGWPNSSLARLRIGPGALPMLRAQPVLHSGAKPLVSHATAEPGLADSPEERI